MKKEHPHAQVLRWIADGETVEAKNQFGIWYPVFDNTLGWLGDLVAGSLMVTGQQTFRIKPKTITVGDREIEAPIKSGPGYFITDTGHELSWFDDERDRNSFADMQKNGRVFASVEAARAAQEAITALLTKEPS
jgi:hypothetical protein